MPHAWATSRGFGATYSSAQRRPLSDELTKGSAAGTVARCLGSQRWGSTMVTTAPDDCRRLMLPMHVPPGALYRFRLPVLPSASSALAISALTHPAMVR